MNKEELLKTKLYDHCLHYAESRLKTILFAIETARESANEEGKSSAGDKHETGRSMAQLEQEKLSHQLQEAEKMRKVMDQFPRGNISSVISTGSLVLTDKGNYFISISAGKMRMEEEDYFMVSPVSPIGQALLKAGSAPAFIFSGQTYRIKKVC